MVHAAAINNWQMCGGVIAGPLAAMARSFVVLMLLSSGFVFTEPAPVDFLLLTLFLLLPLSGLVTITRSLAAFAALSLLPVACAFLGSTQAIDVAPAIMHTAVTAFLVVGSLLFAAFLIHAPERHGRLIFNAYAVAALFSAALGIIGYFNMLPGAGDLFTRFGRATGAFKDPNVFGPFLVAPFIYLLQRLLVAEQRFKAIIIPCSAILAFGVLLSFSRGAWFCLAVSTCVFAVLTFVTARDAGERLKIVVIAGAAVFAAGLLVVIALQFDEIANLLSQRASLTQGYDEGPEGRFGGQQKAKALILANPIGIGAQQFGVFFHIEEAHNVYLSLFLNAGWIGGLGFIAVIAFTTIIGLAGTLTRSSHQPYLIVALSSFVGHALEGFVIDLDHWRHLYLLIGIVWGLALAPIAAGPPLRVLPRAARALRPAHIAS